MSDDDGTPPDPAARTYDAGCLRWAVAAAGAVLVPVFALVALQGFLDAARTAEPGAGHSARRYVVVLLCAVVPLALAGGWRRGRRPLNDPGRVRGRRLGWSAGFVGWLLSRLIVPTNELWLDATLFVLLTLMTLVFLSAFASRVAHGALRRDPDAAGKAPPRVRP